MPRFIVTCYGEFTWYPWKACSNKKGNGGGVYLGKRGGKGHGRSRWRGNYSQDVMHEWRIDKNIKIINKSFTYKQIMYINQGAKYDTINNWILYNGKDLKV